MMNENRYRGLMIVGYKTSAPTGGIKDERGTAAVAATYRATQEVGNFTRRIIPASYLRPFTQERNKWAKYHRQVLVPFARAAKGEGLAKAAVVKEYCNEFRVAQRSVQNGIETIMSRYDEMVNHQREISGDLFIPSNDDPSRSIEIPQREEFRNSFAFELIKPRVLENPDDLIDVFDNEFVEDVKSDVESNLKQAVSDSLLPVFESLLKMSEGLRSYDPNNGRDGAFRKTLVTNVKENAELLSKVNFSDNETISFIQKEILGNLVQYDERQLKDSEPLRKSIADKADNVLDNFEAFGLNS